MRNRSGQRRHAGTRTRRHPRQRRTATRLSHCWQGLALLQLARHICARIDMFTDSKGRLQPAWAFVLSALLCCLAFLVCNFFASAIAGDHLLRFEAIFSPALAAVLLAGFTW